MEQQEEQEAIRLRFRALMTELATSSLQRNSFQSWEVELMLDIDQYEFPRSLRIRLLQRYERAVLRAMAKSPYARPFLFSEYLATTWLGRANPYRRSQAKVNVA